MDLPGRPVRLSDDVLRLILDSLSLQEIVLVSRVSRAWRSVALDHPTYSRNVDLYLTGPYNARCTSEHLRLSLQLFFHRLFYRHSMGSIVSLDVDMTKNLGPSQLAVCADCAKQFGPVYDCLERLIFLGIRIHWRFLPVLFHAISMRPAPQLREFRLSAKDARSSSEISWVLPHNMFSGRAPHLAKLRLGGPLILPDIRAVGCGLLPALSAVKELRLDLDWIVPEMSRAGEEDGFPSLRLDLFFVHCAVLERLVLRCDEAVGIYRDPSWGALPSPEALNLRHLSFLGKAIYFAEGGDEDLAAWGRDVDTAVRAFVHPRMESLEVNTNAVSEDTLLAILAHLGSDSLHLETTTRDTKYARLTLHSVPRGIKRTFCHARLYSDQTDVTMFNKCLAPIASQIVHLTIHRHYDVWSVAVQILRFSWAALQGVERLTVVLGYEDDLRDEEERQQDAEYGAFESMHFELHLPALRCLELVGPNSDEPLTVDDIARFMGRLLRRVARRDLLLILRAVTAIEGDISRIWGYFERIEFLP